jgi:hypothetical protein
MKNWIIATIAGVAFLTPGNACIAQGSQTVQFERVFKSRSLNGIIRIHWNQSPISAVIIEDCTPGWKGVSSSTVFDANGRFTLQSSKDRIHYLRLTSPGFNITLVKIQVTRWSRRIFFEFGNDCRHLARNGFGAKLVAGLAIIKP